MPKKLPLKQIAIVLAVVAVIVLACALHLTDYLTLQYLQSSRAHFADLYAQYGLALVLAYMGIYIVVTACSLPGAAILTLAGGALFGRWVGLVAVSFASTIGATLAFLMARFLLKDWVQNKFGDKLKPINQGVAKEGAFYLFTMRLVPAFPFFVVNLVMGLTTIRPLTFFVVSQLGMLPGTFVFVNAGTELSKITSLKGILSPGLLLSFVALGLLPIAVKKLLGFLKK